MLPELSVSVSEDAGLVMVTREKIVKVLSPLVRRLALLQLCGRQLSLDGGVPCLVFEQSVGVAMCLSEFPYHCQRADLWFEGVEPYKSRRIKKRITKTETMPAPIRPAQVA